MKVSRNLMRSVWLSSVVLPGMWVTTVLSADWPTYQHDMRRSAVTEEHLPAALHAQWVYTSPYPPEHAWGDPQPKVVEGLLELPRMRFDDAFHPVASGKHVYYGSSSDNNVYALDLDTGSIVWTYATDAPIRMAPSVWEGNIYVGSDDGWVYCLRQENGSLVWKFHAAPDDTMILSSGRMASFWPIRTGVIVVNDTAYFGAGVFPGEGLYLYSLNAKTGKEIWRNDTYGKGGNGGMSPQGYIVASRTKLFLPSGRSIPTAFDRADGRFLFQRNQSWRSVGQFGGCYAFLADDLLFNGTEQIMALKAADGGLLFSEDARRVIVSDKTAYLLTGEDVLAIDWKTWRDISRRRLGNRNRIIRERPNLERLERQEAALKRSGKPLGADFLRQLEDARKKQQEHLGKRAEYDMEKQQATQWKISCSFTDSMILAGSTLFVGGNGEAIGIDVMTGKQVWSARFEGKARGIIAANGHLLITTDKGSIHCFGEKNVGKTQTTAPETVGNPYVSQSDSGKFGDIAEQIVADSGIRRGFALIMGGGTGEFAFELAKRTDLLIHMVESDPCRVAQARELLSKAGIYGGKVIVLEGDLRRIPYSDYFANLIVCQDSFETGVPATPPDELLRMLKPCGGIAYFGHFSKEKDVTVSREFTHWSSTFENILAESRETSTKLILDSAWGKACRGTLPGAADWTHQYGNAGNTASSEDTAVHAPIGVLWYGEPGPGRMPSRHASNAAPLCVNGRMFVQGENVIMVHDAYNGLKLWEREIPGALRLGLKTRCSNLAASKDSLFVVAGGKCLCLDSETGETLKTYQYPTGNEGEYGSWGEYIACVDNTLYGTFGSDTLFALDAATGKLRWRFKGTRIMPTTVCVDQDRIFFVDFAVSDKAREKVLAEVDEKLRTDRRGNPISPDIRRVVALDALTGKLRWEHSEYLSDCVKIGSAGGELTMMASQGIVLLCGQPWNGHFWKEFFAGDFTRRSLIALSAGDGSLVWSGRKGYRSRPLIVGSTVFAEPWAHDLFSGKPKERINPLTGSNSKWQFSRPGHHCGNVVGSPNMLFFRSWSLAYYDLKGDYGTAHFGAQRNGCWINTLPTNGLVVMPEASSSCQCAFPLQCTMVFKPRAKNRVWGMYSVEGSATPIKRLGVNFGAPGDRKSSDGALWLSWPRPQSTRLVFNMKVDVQIASGGGYTAKNTEGLEIDGTSDPWIYASGLRGPRHISFPLIDPAEGAALYRVRLLFATTGDSPSQFDIKLQGKDIAANVDISAETKGENQVYVKEFGGIRVDGDLTVELFTKKSQPTPEELPVLHGMEIVREQVLEIGLGVSDVVISNLDTSVEGEVRLGNFTDENFTGSLELAVPDQFEIVPHEKVLQLESGKRLVLPMTLKLLKTGEPRTLPIICKLVKQDGTVAGQQEAKIEYLGKRGRIVITPDADATVNAGNPTKTNGHAPTLAVDGGASAMGDHSHNIVYMRFPLDAVPGKPVSALFRIYVPRGGHTQSSDSGVIRVCDGEWEEEVITFGNAPKPGKEIAKLGRVDQQVWVERQLDIDLTGRKQLTLVLDPTSCDGATYVSREGPEKPELVVEYGMKE